MDAGISSFKKKQNQFYEVLNQEITLRKQFKINPPVNCKKLLTTKTKYATKIDWKYSRSIIILFSVYYNSFRISQMDFDELYPFIDC